MDVLKKINHPAAEVYTTSFTAAHKAINNSGTFRSIIILTK